MKSRRPLLLALLPALLPWAVSAIADTAAIPLREWKSSAGTTLKASVEKLDGTTAVLKKENGQEVRVPLDKLAPADRATIETHFAPPPAKPDGAPAAAPAEGAFPWPQGKASEPVDAGGDSHFRVFLPKSLKPGGKIPLLFFTNSGGWNSGIVTSLSEGAEIAQWAVAVSVESKNSLSASVNTTHAMNCLKTIEKMMPLDRDRVYFSGSSGGARMAVTNAFEYKVAGIIPIIAGHGESTDNSIPKVPIFYIDGAGDYNRYEIASAFRDSVKTSVIRYHTGGHTGGAPVLQTEGIIWHRCLDLKKNRAALGAQAAELDDAILAFAAGLAAKEPGRALQIVNYLMDTKPTAAAATKGKELHDSLMKDPLNARYLEGVEFLEDVARKTFSQLAGGAYYNVNPPTGAAAAEKVATKFADVPAIAAIAKRLSEATVGEGK